MNNGGYDCGVERTAGTRCKSLWICAMRRRIRCKGSVSMGSVCAFTSCPCASATARGPAKAVLMVFAHVVARRTLRKSQESGEFDCITAFKRVS